MTPKILGFLFYLLLVISSGGVADQESPPGGTSIIFAGLGSKDLYAFDIYTLPTNRCPPKPSHETQITDGKSYNFNGRFASPSSSILSLVHNQSPLLSSALKNSSSFSVVYATERDGSANIHLDVLYNGAPRSIRSRSALEDTYRFQLPLLRGDAVGFSFKDKPTLVDDQVIYVSTHEDPGQPRTSWAAVYSTDVKTGFTRRLTPYGIADFSPAVSPSGVYTAVASYGERGWNGEVEALTTDIYVFLTRDGSRRLKIVENGGWPTWADESTLYFHRRNKEDGWISVYRAIILSPSPNSTDSVIVERITPPGVHAFTPASSPGNHNFIAVATRRSNSKYRHIELFDLVKNEFIELTKFISPHTHHFNPFISPDSSRVGYHRCRGAHSTNKGTHFMLENIVSPVPEISLFRVDEWFPSWSPEGDRMAIAPLVPGVYVANIDGSDLHKVYNGSSFLTTWSPVKPGIIYFSSGPIFQSTSTEVDIFSLNVDQPDIIKKLTINGKNNAFPSVSPDGKWIVFRSGIHGFKSLYIMDAEKGEEGGLFRLTEGPWNDTMCVWSPDGEWIVFSSNRDDPTGHSFELFLIHPNGTGLRKVFQSGSAGRVNHATFSPDGKSIAFTSDYAGLSAEPISNQHMFQPYGEIFTVNLDGTGIKRLTHNSFEDGLPAWGWRHLKPADVRWQKNGVEEQCSFRDVEWSWL